MAQFPSLVARRRSKRGDGIKARWPEPTGEFWISGQDDFVVQPPFGDALRQAALIERFYLYANQYAEIETRFTGHDDFAVAPYPLRYALGPFDDVYSAMLMACYAAWPNPFIAPRIPNVGEPMANLDGDSISTVFSVSQEWTKDDETTQLLAALTTPGGWVGGNGAGFQEVPLHRPAIHLTYGRDTDHPLDYIETADFAVLPNTPFYRGERGAWDVLAIQMLLWGKCFKVEYLTNQTGGLFFGPIAMDEVKTIAYIEAYAGRVLWQMAHVATLLMCEDLLNIDKGGRGGLTGQEQSGGSGLYGHDMADGDAAGQYDYGWITDLALDVAEDVAVDLMIGAVAALLIL